MHKKCDWAKKHGQIYPFYQFFHDCWYSLIDSVYFTSCRVYISIFHEQPGHYFHYSLVHVYLVELGVKRLALIPNRQECHISKIRFGLIEHDCEIRG